MKPTLLVVLAHPDDEVFGSGGTMATYADRGVHVVLACATRGEVGEISDPALATPETLGEVREQELRTACEALNVSELVFLDYRDSGMEGTPENEDPRSYVRADPEHAIRQLVELIRRVKPQVVTTFEPFGGYGHPDHIAVSKYTTAAFDAAGDPAQYPDAGKAWQPQRLFYSILSNSFFEQMKAKLEEMGEDTSEFDRFGDRSGRPSDDSITTIVDVAGYVPAKWAAANAHRTQFGPKGSFFRRIPEEAMSLMIAHENFWEVRLAPGETEPVKTDLFEGLVVR